MKKSNVNYHNLSNDDFDYLVYLRITENCNLYCEHCFIPANPKKMTLIQIENVPNIISSFAKKGSRILIQWHGGEPTSVGYKWLENAINILNKNNDFYFIHNIQTNLVKYDKHWRDLYKKYFNGYIGVSYDPSIRRFKNRPNSNNEYENIFWENIQKLNNDGIVPCIVITGTKVFFEKIKNPFVFFETLKKHNIKYIHIEKLTKTGRARQNWDKLGVSNAEWSKQITKLSRAYFIYKKNNNLDLQISPIDGITEAIIRLNNGGSGGYGCLSGACDIKYHTIDANGYKKGCTALNSELDNPSIETKSINVINIDKLKEIRKKRIIDCKDCKYIPICSCGCLLSIKTDGSDECSGGYNIFKNIDDFLNIKI